MTIAILCQLTAVFFFSKALQASRRVQLGVLAFGTEIWKTRACTARTVIKEI